jgi:hypothetical protein
MWKLLVCSVIGEEQHWNGHRVPRQQAGFLASAMQKAFFIEFTLYPTQLRKQDLRLDASASNNKLVLCGVIGSLVSDSAL